MLTAWESYSQNTNSEILERCNSIYVWDFTDHNKQQNRTTDDVTNAVEEALVNIAGCSILERRKIATLLNQQNAQIHLIATSASDLKNTKAFSTLQIQKAKLVLFGKVDMSARDKYEITLSIENLLTTKIVRKKSKGINAADLLDIDKRNTIIISFVNELLGNSQANNKEVKELPSAAAHPVPDSSASHTPINNTYPFFKDVFPGVDIKITAVKGSKDAQTVIVFFTIINQNAPNQTFGLHIHDGYAQDKEGVHYPLVEIMLAGTKNTRKYSEPLTSILFYNGKLACSATYANVMPSVNKLGIAVVPFIRQLNGERQLNANLNFADLIISW